MGIGDLYGGRVAVAALLERHGETGGENFDGWLDTPLTVQGRREAKGAGTFLRSLPAHLRPRRIVSSPLQRARVTADIAAEILGIKVVDELK